MQEIKSLEAVLRINGKIVEYETKRLTAPGENYGSLMLAVKVKLDSGELLEVVAKLCPPNEWIKKMFNIPITFKREIEFYQSIVPTLQEFQKTRGVENVMEFYPKFYGARVTLNENSDKVDDDAVLLLENLNSSGYQVLDRMEGYDLETTKVVLKDLATFHAVPIALKLLQPDVFKEKIAPYLTALEAFKELPDEIVNAVVDTIIKIIETDHKCIPYSPKVRKAFDLWHAKAPPSEPFATMIHNDFWTNNMMMKFQDNKPVGCKMVDFQLIEYGSPARDLIFFLFSSVKKQVLDLHYHDLVRLYFNQFEKTLKSLKCDLTEFTYDRFDQELKDIARSELSHVLIMLKPIYSLKGKVKELSEMTEADMLDMGDLSELYPKRMLEIVQGFADKGLI